jgi:hypothetical protein
MVPTESAPQGQKSPSVLNKEIRSFTVIVETLFPFQFGQKTVYLLSSHIPCFPSATVLGTRPRGSISYRGGELTHL